MRINHYMAALKQHLEERNTIKPNRNVELAVKRMKKVEDEMQRIVDGYLECGLQTSHL
jgi:hypothetical protein